jgi:hypothetical protein
MGKVNRYQNLQIRRWNSVSLVTTKDFFFLENFNDIYDSNLIDLLLKLKIKSYRPINLTLNFFIFKLHKKASN